MKEMDINNVAIREEDGEYFWVDYVDGLGESVSRIPEFLYESLKTYHELEYRYYSHCQEKNARLYLSYKEDEFSHELKDLIYIKGIYCIVEDIQKRKDNSINVTLKVHSIPPENEFLDIHKKEMDKQTINKVKTDNV